MILVSMFSGTYLTAQLSIGYVELAEHVARREGHLIQVTWIPSYRRRRVRRRRVRRRRRDRGGEESGGGEELGEEELGGEDEIGEENS